MQRRKPSGFAHSSRSCSVPLNVQSPSMATTSLPLPGQFHARTKHIDIRYHFIRFEINNGHIRLVYCPTNDMVADTFTKALPSIKAKHFATALGLSAV